MTLPSGSLLPPRGQGFWCAGAWTETRDQGVNPAEHASCALENEIKFTLAALCHHVYLQY